MRGGLVGAGHQSLLAVHRRVVSDREHRRCRPAGSMGFARATVRKIPNVLGILITYRIRDS
jgi:hypothetical protein